MKPLLCRMLPSLVLLVVLAGCQVDVDQNYQFECADEKDCTEGFVCEYSPSVDTKVCVEEGTVPEGQDAGSDADDTGPDVIDDTGSDDTGPDTACDESSENTYFSDRDGDGFGDPTTEYKACQPENSTDVNIGGDCNDNDSTIHPDATEICPDNIDNDCDDEVDNGILSADQVVTGDNHTCALVQGKPYCWGKNDKGQLGDQTTSTRHRPTEVDISSVGGTFEMLTAGANFTCGLTTGKRVWCWGSNQNSALGRPYDENDTNTLYFPYPVEIQGLPNSEFVELAAGNWHVCGVTMSNTVHCWGHDGNEQLGRQVNDSFTHEVGEVDGGQSFVSITAGGNHTCAIEETTDDAYCWGRNFEGQGGDGSGDTWIYAPTKVDSTISFQMIAAGQDHTCATNGSDAYCWGRNADGQLGDGTSDKRPTPVQVQGASAAVKEVQGGSSHTCGLLETGDLACWGDNFMGQLGDGTSDPASAPQTVQSTHSFGQFDLGQKHTCARSTNDNEIYCWGSDASGQRGNGPSSSTASNTPEPVPCP